MARYNTVVFYQNLSGSTTITATAQNQLTEITGTPGSTTTLPDPTKYPGYVQTFYNATTGNVSIYTPSGTFIGASSNNANTYIIPPSAAVTVNSDGMNFVISSENGSYVVGTTGNFSSNVNFTGPIVRSSATQTFTDPHDLTTKDYVQYHYGYDWVVMSSNFNATAGGRYFVNTSGGPITATLPATPLMGDQIHFIDYNGTFATNNFTVFNNGNYIQRLNDSLLVSTNGAAFQLVYSGSTNPGWLVANGI